jgi:hypothetical protein
MSKRQLTVIWSDIQNGRAYVRKAKVQSGWQEGDDVAPLFRHFMVHPADFPNAAIVAVIEGWPAVLFLAADDAADGMSNTDPRALTAQARVEHNLRRRLEEARRDEARRAAKAVVGPAPHKPALPLRLPPDPEDGTA